MNIKKDIVIRIRAMFLFMLLLAAGIIWKIFFLQTIEGNKWREKAKMSYVEERTIEAVRGNIFADDGSLLATSLPKYKLGFDPLVSRRNKKNAKIYDDGIDSLCHSLANFYHDKTAEEYYSQIDLARRRKITYIVLNNDLISYQDVKKMRKWPVFRAGKYKGGVVFEKVNVRYNPFEKMGVRTIGYKKDKEKVGIENAFDVELSGTSGKGVFEKIVGGSWRPVEGGEKSIPVQGLDVHSTLNVNIQDVAETSLMNALRKYRADKGCVIVMEVATGEIKAMTNLSKVGKDSSYYSETYNHAVLNRTDPGSVFKLPSMIAIMEEGGLENTELVNTGDGTIKIGTLTTEDSKKGGHGMIPAQEVFEVSSNVGIMRLMQKYFGDAKQKKYYEYLKKFHLNEPLKFQLKPDVSPVINEPKAGDKTAMYWNSIGYGELITPLQMLTFYNAVANNGKWIQPIIVKSTKIADEVVQDFHVGQTVYPDPICSEKTLEKVRKMLEGVVEHGTAKNINNPMYKIAGKTGTSQKLINGKYREGMYYTSFMGFFPAESPKYSIAVVIDNPRGVKLEALYASDACAPVFKEIADKIYANDIQMHKLLIKEDGSKLNFAKQKVIAHSSDIKVFNDEMSIDKSPQTEGWTAVKQDSQNSFNYEIKYNKKNRVPDTRGMSLRDAMYVLENKGLKVRVKGIGKVTSQSIPPGANFTSGRTIELILQ
ncbi:penicillin-binding protein [Flectobacillus rivi]|uniref:Penicillin-binding protein n=1 Tax=Flectobacillus rivi TaxID=2984209 RepID=A0ABT6Z8M3_9BACT|nr:penicillin-binding protein [Flectobacillus rivi]MDI9877485.1 penicillin-binding protein [Flectobacillus rivi]